MSFYLFLLAGIFAFFFLVDILGHIILKLRRNAGAWILTCLVFCGFAVSLFFGVSGFHAKSSELKSATAFAYRYLKDGDLVSAGKKADKCSPADRDMIRLLISAKNNSPMELYLESSRLLYDGAVGKDDLESVKKMQELSAQALGISGSASSQGTAGSAASAGSSVSSGSPGTAGSSASSGSPGTAGSAGSAASAASSRSSAPAQPAASAKTSSAASSKTTVQNNAAGKDAENNLALQFIKNVPKTDKSDRETRKTRLSSLADAVCSSHAKISGTDQITVQDYTADKAITTGDLSKLDAKTVQDLLSANSKNPKFLLLAVKYYASRKDYTSARDAALKLIKVEPTTANYVVFTDIVAQQAENKKAGGTAAAAGSSGTKPAGSTAAGSSSEDPEARRLITRAEALEKESAKTKYSIREVSDLQQKAEELRTEASNLTVRRTINYLISKEPATGDKSGMYDLQIAKLYLAANDRKSAKKYIWKVVDNAGTIDDKSPIKKPLEEVVNAYNELARQEKSPKLSGAVNNLISAQSGDVIDRQDGTVNSNMTKFVASTIKYDRLSVNISKIDSSGFPNIKSWVNVSGEKNGKTGAAGDFAAADFKLIDTNYKIADFKLLKDQTAAGVSIALVLDCSGSMTGQPVADAKKAAEACVRSMDPASQRMALIPYNYESSVKVPLTSVSADLISGIRSINAGGGTYISGAIRTGLGQLGSASGTGAIILMTDGQDNDPSEIEKTIQQAKDQSIPIYTVGLGDVNTDFLQNIADKTGGIFINASNSGELEDIYLRLQKYIVNNYCFEYTVTKNPEVNSRELTVDIPQYKNASDTRHYTVGNPGGATDQDAAENGSVYPVDKDHLAVYSVSPGGINAGVADNGISVTVNGSGFQDGLSVSIGSIALTGLKVNDPGSATGMLKGALAVGTYDVTAEYADGKTAFLNDGFYVYRAGTVTTVILGDMTIHADSIGLVSSQSSGSELFASGSVTINGFLRSTTDLSVKTAKVLKDSDISGQSSLYLGENGSVDGNGKLYVSYANAQSAISNGNSLEQYIGHKFSEVALHGEDLVLKNGIYSIKVGSDKSEMKTGEREHSVSETVANFSIALHNMPEIKGPTITLYADRLQLDAQTVSIDDLKTGITAVLCGKDVLTKKDRDAVTGKYSDPTDQEKSKVKKLPLLDVSASVAIMADDIKIGGGVNFQVPQTEKFSMFPIKQLGVSFNTLDKDYEYWSLSVKVAVPGAEEKSPSVEVKLGSYFYYADSLKIDVNLNPGIPVFKVLELTKITMDNKGLSYFFIKDPNTPKKDFSITAGVTAEMNLFKMFGIDKGIPDGIVDLGKLGSIDAKAGVDFIKPSIDITADLTIFKKK
jgi:uncharacterized protein YegL